MTLQNDKYIYKPYSKLFPILFKKEKNRISNAFKIPLAIEHVGSTAIVGLGGKGIIDIAIAVPQETMQGVSKILQMLGYELRPTFSTSHRLYFRMCLADAEDDNRKYHLHLTYPSSKEWKELVGFRDYLRIHPESVHEYAHLKQEAVKIAKGDGASYRRIKASIFEKINLIM